MASDFYRYFKENMDSLGLPAPETLYGNLQLALTNATALVKFYDEYGPRVTVKEMAKLGTRFERLVTLGACTASFYVGAVIGSIAVATGRSLSGGTSIADVLIFASRHDVKPSWLPTMLARYPGIYDSSVRSRSMYRFSASE
jgi:hypothetical protein